MFRCERQGLVIFGIGSGRGSVGRKLINSTPNCVFDYLQTRVVQLFDQAEGGGQQVGALYITNHV